MITQRHRIGGVAVTSTSPASRAVVDPATEETVALIPVGTAEDAEAAAGSAHHALPGWSSLSMSDRAQHVSRLIDVVEANADMLAAWETKEMGHSTSLAAAWIRGVVGTMRRIVEAAESRLRTPLGEGDTIHRVPYGVAALIPPWNFPLVIALRTLPALLMAGNTVVWKPSEKSPLSALALWDLLELPDGVVNVLLGDATPGRALVAHRLTSLVVHTGSVAAGRDIAAVAGAKLVPAVLELGGNDPVLIDRDVDPAWAADVVAAGAFVNTGQLCTSIERIYVHKDIADRFVSELVSRANAEVLGPGAEASTTMGPLVDRAQLDTVERHVEDAVSRGGRVLAGGRRPERPGYFFPPTVLVDVPADSLLMREETFGPVAPIVVVENMDAAVALASDTEYGLSATILSGSSRADELALQLPAGSVSVNEWGGFAPGEVHEPAGISGLGAVGPSGGILDAVSRPVWIHRATPKPPTGP